MASSLQSGISAAAVNRYIRGPGKVYKNFTSIASPGTLLGETKGGSTFDWGLEFYDVEPDGAMGLVKGHRFIAKCMPSLEVNLLEHTTTNWLGFLPGANSSDETPTRQVEYLGLGSAVRSGVTMIGGGDIDFSTLELWYGTTSATKAELDTDYTVNESTGTVTAVATGSGGSIDDTAEVTVVYEYDSTASGDAFTVIKPGQIAAADHWTNIALVCELTNQTYSNPYAVIVVKNALCEPAPVAIPGSSVEESILTCKFIGFFDPDTGLSLESAPVEFQLGRS